MEHSWGYGTEQRLREENQDCHGVFEFPEFTLSVVCDGMGGHVGGAQASSLAVRTLHDALLELQHLHPAEALVEAIQQTNVVIYEAARKNHRLMGMGTTVVAALVQGNQCWIAHVGDSRAYLVRGGEVHPLTRDHTMVNLFVDAELLSPEDAATHPEAHVLSRSLGVERQVEVEVTEPLPLEPEDLVFLCTDGVHGLVADWELAGVDWKAPQAAIRQVLDMVVQRDGDDNATAVAVFLGTTFEDTPPTAPPVPKRMDESRPLAAAGATAVPDEEEGDFLRPDQARPAYALYQEESRPPNRFEEQVVAPPPGSVAPEPRQPLPEPAPLSSSALGAAAAEPAAPAKPPPAPAKPKASTSQRMPLVFAAGAMGVAVLVLGLLLFPGQDTQAPAEPAQEEVIQLAPDEVGGAAKAPVKASAPEPGEAPAPPPAVDATDCPADSAVFAPKLPPPPRRLPYRATECTQPPPGGPEQYRAVEAQRRHDCRAALEAVQAGMRKSVDHCRLYQAAWLCFDESHQRPLENTTAETFADLRYDLYHLEGTPDLQKQLWTEQSRLLPTWFRPAVDGLEYRLETWNSDPQMAHYVNDLFGEPKVADAFAKDLHLEATLAAGLACAPEAERTPEMVEAWSRRVFVVANALNQDRVGRLLNQHRSDLQPVLRDLLARATKVHQRADGSEIPVPEAVTEAYEVATGVRPPPTERKKVVAPRPVDPRIFEPDLGEEEGIQINQR